MGLDTSALKAGQRYRIVFDAGMQKEREAVMRYVGRNFDGTPMESLVFDARPLAGTQLIQVDHVKELWETSRDLMLPQIYRGEVRVF